MKFSGHKYNRSEVERVSNLDIRHFIPGAVKNKGSQELECPACGKKAFSVVHRGGKNFAYCHACQLSLPNPIAAYAYYNNLSIETDYLKALEGAAHEAGVTLISSEEQRQLKVEDLRIKNNSSFCRRQLEASGLNEDDVLASVVEHNQEKWVSPFIRGGVVEGFLPDERGDEMLIWYYDLYGRPMTYTVKGSTRLRPYFRVLWSNPELHGSSEDKAPKYLTPPGSSCRVYIPEMIRKYFRNKTHIETLFLQEGEKKAEKACKHGMPSIGIQGINNFGSKEEGLLQDIQEIARVCSISNIVLVMDSDWNDLSKNIIIGDRADKRPNSFSKAVIKYRQYMKTFRNINLSVDIWWGHVNANPNGDKGIDDLLCGSLLGRESELMDDVRLTMNSHNGKGKWLNIHKITEVSDTVIRDFWYLNDVHEFYNQHSEELFKIENFKIGSIRYKVENGTLVPVSRYSSSVDIFSISTNQKGEEKVEFDDVETFRFLAASGFSRLRNSEDAAGGFDYIRIEDGIIDRIAPYEVRDFIRDYVNTNIKSKLVLHFFAKRLSSIMADKQLENLPIIADDFNNFEPGVQRTYYNNGQVEITSRSILPGKPISNVWRSRIIPRKFKRTPIISNICSVDGRFDIEYTEAAARCDFLQYLINTSNNNFLFGQERELTEDEIADWNHHIVNKITTLGYLLCDYKYSTERKAVVIQDHLMSEVGQSHGGAGKSILGDAISRIVPQFFINGKTINVADEFLLSGVTKVTRNIFIDDVRVNFDFTKLSPLVTGQMPVNPKGKDRYTIATSDSPKILITTNHAINNASDGSVKRRITYMEYSNWYNPEHMPIDDFHRMLFDDWDDEQWNLFDNLMAECVLYYLRSREDVWWREGQGAVPPPMRNVELRSLRQAMGETFLAWAEEYFDFDGPNLNRRCVRKDLWASFLDYAGGLAGHNVTRTNIRLKLEKFCEYKGYDLNITRPHKDNRMCYADWKPLHQDDAFFGGDDKSGGVEYLTIFSSEKEKLLKPF